MRKEQIVIKSANDQISLYGMVINPDIPAIGIIQFVHGMAEHKERYNEVMERKRQYNRVWDIFMIILQ